MKHFCISVTMLMTAGALLGQPGKPVAKPVTKPVAKPVTPLLKTTVDSVCYILGESTAYNLQSQNLGDLKLNMPVFNKGFADFQTKKKPLIDQASANQCLNTYYQTKAAGTPVAPPKPNPAAVGGLKTNIDSLSYILGQSMATNFFQQGFTDFKFNMAIYNRGMSDVLGKKKPLIDDVQANATVNAYYFRMQEQKAKINIEAGKKFLEQNKARSGVKVTPSGLQYEVISEGTGSKMSSIDTFVCHYRGTLIDGTEFDASYNRGEPLKMAANQVIPGWTEGLQLMPTGSKYKFYIPYQLGYGVMGQGQIPGGAVLIFEVELLDFKKQRPNPVVENSRLFLEQNKLRPEVKTTASGLQYEVLVEGTGPRMTSPLDTFVCHYRGTLVDGTPFDNSYDRGQPLSMAANQVIRGWTEGLQLMPVGSKYKFFIPAEIGYGSRGQGPIPGGAALIFEVELLDFRKKQ